MDPVMTAVLATLRQEALRIGSDLIEEGVSVVEARLRGEATTEDLWAWLRAAQETPAVPEDEE